VNGLDGGDNGRDSAGRFAKGNRGGPGRPPRAIERDYLRALSDRCPVETWGRIVDKAVEDALNGDGPARAWLAKYLLGGFGTSQYPMGLRSLLPKEGALAALLEDI
jgi:hypothetical protein